MTGPVLERPPLAMEVGAFAGYVRSRLAGVNGDVDDVLQEARLALWQCEGRYDPSRGTRAAFVYGVVATVTTRELRQLLERPVAVPQDELDASSTQWLSVSAASNPISRDALTVLLEDADEAAVPRWLPRVREAATEEEWAVLVQLARHDGNQAAAAAALGIPVRTLRAARDRVRTLVRAARAALCAVDDARAIRLSSCVPDEQGLRDVLPYLGSSAEAGAAALGITKNAFRKRRCLLRRVLALVYSISTDTAAGGSR